MHQQHYLPQIVGASNQQIPLMVDIALADHSSGLPIQFTPVGVLLDATGAPQIAVRHTGPWSHVQPTQVLGGEDQLAQAIPAPGQQMLPGPGVFHITGPLQSEFLGASYQVESGTLASYLHPEFGPLSGYHGNFSTEPVVLMQQPQQWQRCHQGCSTALFPTGAQVINMDAYDPPVNFIHDHVPYTNHYVALGQASAPGTHGYITNAHHSTMILEGAPYNNELTELSSRAAQQWMAPTQGQQVAMDNNDKPAVVVQDHSTAERSCCRVLPNGPRCNSFNNHVPEMSLPDRSTNSKPVVTSCPSRTLACNKLDPVMEHPCSSSATNRQDVVLAVTEQGSRHLPQAESIAEDILGNSTVDVTSLQCTLTNVGAAEQEEPADCTENLNNASCGGKGDKQLFPVSYEVTDSPVLSPRATQRSVAKAPCTTTGLEVIARPPRDIYDDNSKTTKDTEDAIEVAFDSADVVRTRPSFIDLTLDDVGGLISRLPQSFDSPDLAEFSAHALFPLDDISNVAVLNPLSSSGDIPTTSSQLSGALWETEDVLKLMSSPSGRGAEDGPVEAVVAQSAACRQEDKPTSPACVISLPAAGTNSTKKRKLSDLQESASDFPPEHASSEPKYQKCCCREGCSGEVKRRAYSRPSTCDLVTMPWTEFFDRLDAQNKRGKNSRKRRASKKRKRNWT